LLIKLS